MHLSTGIDWDRQLRARGKSLRTRPGALLLGSTGARLWADYLDPVPGFRGRFDFIHKTNIPLLFSVEHDLVPRLEPCRATWHPSHLRLEYDGERLGFREDKFISWEDVAVSCQTWVNRSSTDLRLRLTTYGEAFAEGRDGALYGHFAIEAYGFAVDGVVVPSDPALLHGLCVRPGEARTLIVAAAFGIGGQDAAESLRGRAAAHIDARRAPAAVVGRQRRAYEEWFSKAPRFRSSDPLLDRTWAYRWFLQRHNLADPRYGRLQHPLFYEGRSHKKGKTPFGKGGWEFSKLIPLSAPLHLMDARWYRDPVYAAGEMRTMAAAQDEDGLFCAMTVTERLHSFANFFAYAAYQWYLVHRDADLLRELLPALKRQVAGWRKVYGTDRDALMIEWRHTRTGKEYQPSYWYFHDFPQNPKDASTYTHVKRVDRTVYHYLNTLGVARLCALLGDPEAEAFEGAAAGIRRDVLGKMWDGQTEFFYDLHHETDAMALVKNIVGFYPAWAGMTDARHDGLIEHLLNRQEFFTGCPFPSVSADSPAFAAEGGWLGRFFIKGRNGCMWNGPTWPYTNAIALDALAAESRRLEHRFDAEFMYALREYSYLHFQGRDLEQPGLVEHYSSRSGEPLSDEAEYHHSYYVDLIVRHVAGLSVEADRLVFDPLDTGLDHFRLDGLRVAGHEVRITYGRPGERDLPAGMEAGYRVVVDGETVLARDALCGRAEWGLVRGQQG